ncbi:MAG: hypothetical protein ACE5KT_03570, partial [Methanosarcinales archaeon]
MKDFNKDLFYINRFNISRYNKKTRAGKIFSTKSKKIPDTINPDGYPAFSHDLYSDYARTVMTNLVKNTFYKDQKTLAGESVKLHKSMVQKDKEFHLKGLKFAREVSNIKLQILIGIAAQDSIKNYSYEDTLQYLLNSFPVHKVLEYIEINRNKVFNKGYGTKQKQRIIKYLQNLSEHRFEYYTLKYKNQFRDLLILTHPSESQLGMEKYKMTKYVMSEEPITEKQTAFKTLVLNNLTDPRRFGEILIEHEIPWEITTSLKLQNSESWFARMTQMSSGSLLGNIATLERHQVFSFDEAFDYLKERLTPKYLKASKILPLQVIKAYLYSHDNKVREILRNSFIDSFSVPLEYLEHKKVHISLDISASMSKEPVLTEATIAASFVPNCKDVEIIYFSEKLYREGEHAKKFWGDPITLPNITKQGRGSIKSMVKEIFRLPECILGATDTSVGVKDALENGEEYDFFIVLTDEQQNTGTMLYEVFKKYNQRINPYVMLIVINVTPYEWHNVPDDDPNIIVYQTITP